MIILVTDRSAARAAVAILVISYVSRMSSTSISKIVKDNHDGNGMECYLLREP